MSTMRDGIRQSMREIRASEELKQNTLRYLQEQREKQDRKQKLFPGSRHAGFRYVLAVFCLFFLMGTGGFFVYNRPVSYISIDVNPSIELGINCFGRVVSAQGYNADGRDIVQHVRLKNISYIQAIDRLLGDAHYSRFLEGNAKPVFTVISGDPDTMMEAINADNSFQAYGGVVYSSDMTCMKEAHQHEMSFGKYRACLELLQYDESITVESCHAMTMGEIQSRIETCREHNGNGEGSGGGNHGGGSGHGHHGGMH